MGGCLSSSSRSSCSSGRSNGETISLSCLGLELWRRTRSKKTFSDHVVAFHQSSSLPNRIFRNGKSRSSCIFTQQGCKGINQDSMIVWEDFMSEGTIFCGVFDGHGPSGHLVSRKVRDTLPLKLLSFADSCESKRNRPACCTVNFKSDGDGFDEESAEKDKLVSQWKETFLQSYKAMDKELKSHPSLDCFCSGSTAVSILKKGLNLYVGNIGDSRAILGSKDSNGTMVAIQLTVDLKPDLPKEAERIKGCKGRVFAMQDEPEVSRVWLPFDDAPGLAMARAFGDFCLKEYGVISIPEFTHRTLTEQDMFIVLASDGIWDVLSNEDVVEIVASAPTRSSAARILVEAAVSEWKTKYPTSKVDDCAVVCLYLDGKMDSESDHDEQGSSSPTVESNAVESDDRHKSEPSLQRNCTVRSSSIDIDAHQKPRVEETDGCEDQNWSGLEGVARVNSLVQLPRFCEDRPNT